jgi:hypothetical protein
VGPLALETFTQDRPAIAGKWFDYDPDGHALTPKDQAWIVRDLVSGRHIAFRIASVYDDATAESGLFTLVTAEHDGAAWGAEEGEWVTPRNVKVTGQMCVDLFARVERPCTEDEPWHLRLALFQYFSPLAAIAVAEPGVFIHTGSALAALVDDVTALDGLPEPSSLAELDDAPPPSWQGTDWAFDAFAPDLPEAGMAIGARFVDDGFTGRDDVYWLLASRFDLVRFTVRPMLDGDIDSGLRFTFASAEASRDDLSAPASMPAPVSVDVAVPATGGAWLTFANPDLAPAASELADAAWPHAPPKTTRFDLAIERASTVDGDVVRVLVSPAACIKNATQLGIDENTPPVSNP